VLKADLPVDLFASDMDATLLAGIPAPLASVIRRATRYNPAERQPDTATFRSELEQAMHKLQSRPTMVPELEATDTQLPTPVLVEGQPSFEAAPPMPVIAPPKARSKARRRRTPDRWRRRALTSVAMMAALTLLSMKLAQPDTVQAATSPEAFATNAHVAVSNATVAAVIAEATPGMAPEVTAPTAPTPAMAPEGLTTATAADSFTEHAQEDIPVTVETHTHTHRPGRKRIIRARKSVGVLSANQVIVKQSVTKRRGTGG
jgi:hypothetical protein